jgi:heme-degrading monooxygenase HmoA
VNLPAILVRNGSDTVSSSNPKEVFVSVLVITRVPGDTQQFRNFMASGANTIQQIAEDAKARGCIHHRFGVGDGFVVVVDEWETAEAFQQFFEGNPQIEDVMRQSGAQGAPEFTFLDAIETADQF